MTVISNRMDQVRAKFTQIYRFLQAFNEQKNPTIRDIAHQEWAMWFRDIPEHPAIQIGELHSTDFLLQVTRAEVPPIPQPADELLGWLEEGWEDEFKDVRVHKVWKDVEEVEVSDEKQQMTLPPVRFDDSTERVQLLASWMAQRDAWVPSAQHARKAQRIFDKLYNLYSYLDRDSEQVELVLGDGVLDWDRSDGYPIHHPVLLQRVQLLFDPSVPEFKVVDNEQATELYSPLFRTMPEVRASMITESLHEIEENGWHPLEVVGTNDFFSRLVRQLSADGEFIGSEGFPKDKRNKPVIGRAPVLYLRRRTLGFTIALEKILENIPDRQELPGAVMKVTGVLSEDRFLEEQSVHPFTIEELNGEDEHVLLSKEANADQLQIARRLEQDQAVLVQGPPGTGKTHSIANLLGHLLAQGKSVLVTSHTTKALQVLRDKVVEPLQPLCVSVLDDDGESRQQMEKAIDAITDRLANSDVRELERRSTEFEGQRMQLLAELRSLREQLRNARQDEYRDIVVAGEPITPSKAARHVRAHQDMHDWIPTPVALGEPLPLSLEELQALYATNVQITKEDEQEHRYALPQPSHLIDPVLFAQSVDQWKRLGALDLTLRDDLWTGEDALSPEQLRAALKQAVSAIDMVRENEQWRMVTLEAGQRGETLRLPWEELLAEVDAVYELAASTQSTLLQWGPEMHIADLSWEEVERELDGICQRMRDGGNLGWLSRFTNRNWKKIIEASKVEGKAPEKVDHFEALLQYVRLEQARQRLLNRWERQVVPLGGPTRDALGPEPERIARQFGERVRQCLDWYERQWKPVEATMQNLSFNWCQFLAEHETPLVAHGELLKIRDVVRDKLPAVFEARLHKEEHDRIVQKLQVLDGKLAQEEYQQTDVGMRLLTAVRSRDLQIYQDAYERLRELHDCHAFVQRRRELLEKLERVAPVWGAQVRARTGIHGADKVPGDAKQAWLWRQLHDELERRSSVSMEELQNALEKQRDELRQVTAQLVESRAWAAQVKRTTLQQQQALQGWKTLMRKAGKRTGVRAPRLLAEARKLMPVCQTAVPVWIMPLSRVVENFNPIENLFDVVIIDEASQSDMMALTALYLGKQVVVVGDDEQVSPESVGTRIQEVQQLIDTYLKGIPNAQLYDGISSIYDLAKTSFAMVGLKEHFRCVAPIIQFSNHLSYGGLIKPLRDASFVKRIPPTVAYRVADGIAENKVNEREARVVASLLMAATEQEEYEDATFGVISMFGDQQATAIDTLLHHYMPAKEYQRRKIRCGNPAQFQGDERHVMFLSMVTSPNGDGPLNMLADPGDRFRKRFNVAASRAQDQMWVVHSLDPDVHLKQGDLRRRLIQHAQDPQAVVQAVETVEKRTESEFERLVLRMLMAQGYDVVPQWKVGAYRIDMVVQGGGKKLAVECDGDRWHPMEKIQDDMARQAILERLGWQFVRIRGSQFFRNPEAALRHVFQRLEDLGIPPERAEEHVFVEEVLPTDSLKERIVRRAAELRREWAENPQDFQPITSRKRKSRKNQAQDEALSRSQDLEFLDAIRKKFVKIVDNRAHGGRLWIVGSQESHGDLLTPWISKGYKFEYEKQGNEEIGRRTGWCFVGLR